MRRYIVRALQVALVALVAVLAYQTFLDVRKPKVEGLGGGLVLGPAGIAKLRLGMTVAEANATQQVRVEPKWGQTADPCSVLITEDVGFHFSKTYGLAVITASPTVRTPEGIGSGATMAQVRAAYPKVHQLDVGTPGLPVRVAGYYAAPAPGNARASYYFIFGEKGVRYVSLVLNDQGEECAAGSL